MRVPAPECPQRALQASLLMIARSCSIELHAPGTDVVVLVRQERGGRAVLAESPATRPSSGAIDGSECRAGVRAPSARTKKR
eukprot:6192760-Pleurochrysis_carterae.AAC.1